jgi:hypothetical protein
MSSDGCSERRAQREIPAFIDPQTDWVECHICGRIISDLSRVNGLDLSRDDEYYPNMVPVCPSHTMEAEP